MKKTMRKSALLSSVAMLIVSAIVLTSATYAWFSSSKKVSVTDLNADVKVTTGLLISVDKGDEWGTSFTFDQAENFADWEYKASDVEVFNPVSTKDGKTWLNAVYEGGETQALVDQGVKLGKDFVAIPLWVTGPINSNVKANVTFTTIGVDSASAKSMKFTLLSVDDTDGVTIDETYGKAVAANSASGGGTFNGISSVNEGSVTNHDENDKTNAFISTGGTPISEVAADGGITFTIDKETTTDAPMKFVAFVWLEGNDPDCAMLQFAPTGENVRFSMSLEIVD